MRTIIAAPAVAALIIAPGIAVTQYGDDRRPTPADGFAVHVTAPHMIQGHEMGPVHHYCKTISAEPFIQCLLYDTDAPNAPLTGVEYIIAKSVTRPLVTRGTWNANFHDHALEIATGRVKVLDMPADEARPIG